MADALLTVFLLISAAGSPRGSERDTKVSRPFTDADTIQFNRYYIVGDRRKASPEDHKFRSVKVDKVEALSTKSKARRASVFNYATRDVSRNRKIAIACEKWYPRVAEKEELAR